jgi:hypothetical protein
MGASESHRLKPTLRKKRPATLLRALEQRFLFDAAAIIDPLLVVETISGSDTSTDVSQSSPTTTTAVAPSTDGSKTTSATSSTTAVATHTTTTADGAQVASDGSGSPQDSTTATSVSSTTADSATPQTTSSVSTQLRLTDSAASQSELLTAAISATEKKLVDFANSAEFMSVLAQVFANAGTDSQQWNAAAESLKQTITQSGLGIRVVLLSNSVMNGALGAYAMDAGDGQETIFLNADWLASNPSVDQIVAVQIEELGHAIDHRLNALVDSPGDEGEQFASLLFPPDYVILLNSNDSDRTVINVNGTLIEVECATLSSNAGTTQTPISYTEQATAVSLGTWTIAGVSTSVKDVTITIANPSGEEITIANGGNVGNIVLSNPSVGTWKLSSTAAD